MAAEVTTPFLVVGAGPTGIGAAVRLTELGIDHFVVDAQDALGGMARSITDDRGFTWDLGGHVLHSHFPEFDHAVRASGVGIRGVRRNGWIWLDASRGPDGLVGTPIQQQLSDLPTDLDHDAPVAHLADFYRNNFGKQLYDDFFEPYNHKMWTVPLEQIDDSWTSLRSGSGARNVPPLALAGTIPQRHEEFPYPLGGTGALWHGIAHALARPERIRLQTRVVSLDVEGHVATLDDGTTVRYEHCVSTAPLLQAMEWAGLAAQSEGLVASTLHAVGFGFEGAAPAALADKTWLYCPDRSVNWYRATMLSNYDPGNAGPGRWNVLCEVPVFADQPASADLDAAVAGVMASLRELGVDDSTLRSTFTLSLPMGYPVPTLGRDDVVRAADEKLRSAGIYSRGRFGGWRYESCNQDYSYLQGREAVNAALTGSAENVYWKPEQY